MTREDQNDQNQRQEEREELNAQKEGGDNNPTFSTDLTEAEADRLDMLPGRGARQVEGAEPSEEYVDDHVEGVGEQGPDLLDPTKG